MARKPLLSGPVLNREDVQSRLAGDDLMSRVIENDAAKHGRSGPQSPAALSPPLPPERAEGAVQGTPGDVDNKDASTSASKDLSKQVSNAVNAPLLTGVLTQPRNLVQGPGNTQGEGSAADKPGEGPPHGRPLEPVPAARSARDRVPMRENKERNIRLSIDVPESVYDRIKQYVHEKKVESTRALTLALYEEFLEEEGY